MHLGIELLTLVPLTLTAPAYVELFLSAGKKVISTSFGKDEYASSVILAPYSRVAATGRKCLFLNHKKPVCLYQTGPTELVKLSNVLEQERLHLFLSSSLPLTRAQLVTDFCLNIVVEKRSEIMLYDQTAIAHSGNGKFVIDIGTCEKNGLKI